MTKTEARQYRSAFFHDWVSAADGAPVTKELVSIVFIAMNIPVGKTEEEPLYDVTTKDGERLGPYFANRFRQFFKKRLVTRLRRGKIVVVPPQWVGKFPTKKTMRDRPSKKIGKLKRKIKGGMRGHYKDRKDQPIEGD